MEQMIAYCGLICTACPAYLATQANDQRRAGARGGYVARGVQRAPHHRRVCHLRRLPDGPGPQVRPLRRVRHPRLRHGAKPGQLWPLRRLCPPCDKIEGFLGFVPDARATLDRVRAGLVA